MRQTPESLGGDAVWERHASWWQQEFTGSADPEYTAQILPFFAERLAGAQRVLDLGTGEGQIARVASLAGAELVVGVDRSSAQVAAAVHLGGGPEYLRGSVTALPFEDGSFDTATACLVLEHVGDLATFVGEVRRVLRPGGRFIVILNHPCFQTPGSGWIDDQILNEQYWRSGPYLLEQTTIEQVDATVSIPFAHRQLSTYLNAMTAVGLRLAELAEPAPLPDIEYPDAATIPRLMGWVAVVDGG